MRLFSDAAGQQDQLKIEFTNFFADLALFRTLPFLFTFTHHKTNPALWTATVRNQTTGETRTYTPQDSLAWKNELIASSIGLSIGNFSLMRYVLESIFKADGTLHLTRLNQLQLKAQETLFSLDPDHALYRRPVLVLFDLLVTQVQSMPELNEANRHLISLYMSVIQAIKDDADANRLSSIDGALVNGQFHLNVISRALDCAMPLPQINLDELFTELKRCGDARIHNTSLLRQWFLEVQKKTKDENFYLLCTKCTLIILTGVSLAFFLATIAYMTLTSILPTLILAACLFAVGTLMLGYAANAYLEAKPSPFLPVEERHIEDQFERSHTHDQQKDRDLLETINLCCGLYETAMEEISRSGHSPTL